jgi:hypothetical protein
MQGARMRPPKFKFLQPRIRGLPDIAPGKKEELNPIGKLFFPQI